MEYEELKRCMSKQKEEMTPSERMKAYMAGEEVDFLPYALLGDDSAMADIFGYTTSQMDNDADIMADIIRKKKETFGMEGLGIGLGLRTIGAALGSKLSIPEHGIDHIASHVLMDYKDFGNLEVTDPYHNPILTPMLERAKELKERFPDTAIATSVVGPVSTAAAIRPVENLLRDTRKNPDMLKKLLDLTVDCSLKWMEVFCREFGPSPAMISDPVTCMDILSKKQFDEFSLPYMKKLVKGMEEISGMKPSIHICGKTKAIWEDLGEIGVSAFSVDNCEDIAETKEALGDKLMLIGNVPPVDVMREGTIDEVISACRECILKCADSPMGYQLGTGCQVPIGTPRANVEAFIYAARKYGREAKKGCMPKGICEDAVN